MKCEQLTSHLVEFHFGGLNHQLRPMVEQHITGCPHCLGAYLGLKRDIELGSDPEVTPQLPSLQLRHRVMQDAHLYLQRHVLRPRRLVWAAAAAAVLLAIVALRPYFAEAFRNRQSSTTQSPVSRAATIIDSANTVPGHINIL